MKIKAAIVGAILLLLALPALALAHGEVQNRDPASGKKLRKPPRHVYVTFTETPSRDARMRVTDGCGAPAVKRLERIETTLHADIKRGVPGAWKVSYDIISDEDGHKTKGGYSFVVEGEADCTDAGPIGEEDSISPDDPDVTLPDEGSSFPVVPVAIGGVVLIGLAVAVRTMSSR